jgi:hypothetical protein
MAWHGVSDRSYRIESIDDTCGEPVWFYLCVRLILEAKERQTRVGRARRGKRNVGGLIRVYGNYDSCWDGEMEKCQLCHVSCVVVVVVGETTTHKFTRIM